jgi:hypothetical protein
MLYSDATPLARACMHACSAVIDQVVCRLAGMQDTMLMQKIQVVVVIM